MPTLAKLPIGVLGLTCALFLAFEGTVLAQDVSGAKRRVRMAQLLPAADTDVVLTEAFLTSDEQGRLKVEMSGPMPHNDVERLFWVVDSRTNRYAALRLTGRDEKGYEKDARRIAQAFKTRGGDRRPEDFISRLRDNHIAAERRFSEGKARAIQRSERPQLEANAACQPEVDEPIGGPKGEDDAQWTYTCQGYGNVEVELWELAKKAGLPVDHLNETNLEVDWIRDTPGSFNMTQGPYNYYSISPWGTCWANPLTFFQTHWYTSWCSNTVPVLYQNSFDVSKIGYYYNGDFLPVLGNWLGITLAPESIQVVSTAAVQHTYGAANWGQNIDIHASATWFQWVGENFLLSGEITGTAFEYNCSWHCDPPSQEVYDCENDPEVSGTWDWTNCYCVWSGSPIIIDLDADGLSLTGPADGVLFDLRIGRVVKAAWTKPGANDAFLALDRNDNGTIDDGGELFGNLTAQPPTDRKGGPNGFLALRVFDQRGGGGNDDEQISDEDSVYSRMKLWIDGNHDGISQADELHSLSDKGVRSISLRYQLSRKTDEFGNAFRFLSRVATDQNALAPGPRVHQAIDVFLKYISPR